MKLQETVQKLSMLEYALVHGGPRHPKYPHPSFAGQIAQVFEEYPQLKKDGDFTDFLEMYVGAIILYPDNSVQAAINGVWDYTAHLLEPEVLEQGKYLRFATIIFEPPAKDKLTGVSFAFDLSHDVLSVYRTANVKDEMAQFGVRRTPHEYYCDTFIEWLEKLVEAKGRLID